MNSLALSSTNTIPISPKYPSMKPLPPPPPISGYPLHARKVQIFNLVGPAELVDIKTRFGLTNKLSIASPTTAELSRFLSRGPKSLGFREDIDIDVPMYSMEDEVVPKKKGRESSERSETKVETREKVDDKKPSQKEGQGCGLLISMREMGALFIEGINGLWIGRGQIC
jgi:hypothetical protein